MSHSHAHPTHRRQLAIACAIAATIPLAEVVGHDTEVLSPAAWAVEADALTEGVSL